MPCLRFSCSRPNKYYMLFNHYLQYNLFISAKNVLGNIIYYVCSFSFILTIMTYSQFRVLEGLNGNDQKSSFDRLFYVKMHF